jgi:hypothetical protein
VLDFNGKTKYFTYGAACEDGSCDALVRRHFDDFGEVEVNANKSPSTNIWEETSCRYSNRSEANKAKAFCSAFGLEAEYEK